MWVNSQSMRPVVVGCDSSWESQHAVVAATREASQRGAELVLLAVAERQRNRPDSLAWVSLVEAESAQDAERAAALAMAKAKATDPTVAVRTVIAMDVDSPALVDSGGQAGLLVLGRRGDEGLVAFSLGSTSCELAKCFNCPILVVHDHDPPRQARRFGPERAVFARMDNTARAGTVLAVAATEAVIRGLPLVVIHALPRGQAVDHALIAQDWYRYQAALRDAQLPPYLPSRVVITQGDPVQALLNRVGPADVLVVGTRGQGRLEELIVGSVSRQILDENTCDVIVVRSGLTIERAVRPEVADLLALI